MISETSVTFVTFVTTLPSITMGRLHCSICSKSYGTKCEFDKHVAQVHNLGQNKVYKCDMCAYQSYDVFNRNQHKIDAHFRPKLQKTVKTQRAVTQTVYRSTKLL